MARMPTRSLREGGREELTFPENGKWNQGDLNILRFRKLFRKSKGATAIEYGLIAALIAVAAIAAMQGLGTSIRTTFNNAASAMNG